VCCAYFEEGCMDTVAIVVGFVKRKILLPELRMKSYPVFETFHMTYRVIIVPQVLLMLVNLHHVFVVLV
jgi:hypothetical protein